MLLNTVVGGITMWMRPSPYVVAAHFIAAAAHDRGCDGAVIFRGLGCPVLVSHWLTN
ncbi:hypothetical protein [Streptomyces viridosporus]|uniref:hypothetical protein n=1 Tax=Streptomyces viridosporus TaxID=67581 RepID=UPI001CC72D1E|nr:hypothetical protein [Streptomyces viridosporus]